MIRQIKNLLSRMLPNFYKRLARLKNETVPRAIFSITHREKVGTLVYVGMNVGDDFATISYKFNRCICFEANPENYIKLTKRFASEKNVEIYNYAVAKEDGHIDFNISDNGNNAASSSVGIFAKHRGMAISKTIQVPSINLNKFLLEKKVNGIDEYVSDIEGMDLTVLKTLTDFLGTKIRVITCEVCVDGKPRPYSNLDSNYMADFERLLSEKYELVSTGWGILREEVFDEVPEDYSFMDAKWKIKDELEFKV